MLIECEEYKEERRNFEADIRRLVNKEWEEIKQSEDKGNEKKYGY